MKKKPKRVRLKKVTPIKPDLALVELEIEGDLPENLPAEPIELIDEHAEKPEAKTWIQWLKGLF